MIHWLQELYWLKGIDWLRGIYWNIQRVLRWIPIIWKDREFDSSYFYKYYLLNLN